MLPTDSRFYLELLDQLEEPVYMVDRARRITFWNRAAEQVTGYRRTEIVGLCCADSILLHIDTSGRSACSEGCPLHRALDGSQEPSVEMFLRHKDGHRIPVRVRAVPVRDARGAVVGAAEMFTETSSRDEIARRLADLQRLALLDPVTALPNRRYLETQVTGRLDELKRYGWPFGVLFLDVDGFKEVNDTHGHPVGDEVLRMLARTLAASSRIFDTVGRWGGDEFLAVVANVQETTLIEVGERFRTLIESSVVKGSAEVRVTVSVGAAYARRDDDMGELIGRADELMYEAKRGGRNRVCAQAATFRSGP